MKGSRRSASPRMPRHRGRLRPLLAALPLALVALGAPWAAHLTAQTAPVTQRASEADFREESGVLGDGTEWIIRVPANWNGVLLRDLDVAGWARETPLTYYLLSASETRIWRLPWS